MKKLIILFLLIFLTKKVQSVTIDKIIIEKVSQEDNNLCLSVSLYQGTTSYSTLNFIYPAECIKTGKDLLRIKEDIKIKTLEEKRKLEYTSIIIPDILLKQVTGQIWGK